MNQSPAIRDVRYVKTPDGAHIAYQVFGSGPFDVVFVPGFIWNVAGHHTFKGVPDEWELFAAVPRAKEPLV